MAKPSEYRQKPVPPPKAPEGRYCTVITVETFGEWDGESFFEAGLTYHNLPLVGVALIERELIEFQRRLRDEGDRLAGIGGK